MSAAEKDINTALSVRLAEFQTAGEPPIAYENAAFTPVDGVLYLLETFIPNIKDQLGLGHSSADDYEGFYQITVNDSRSNRRFTAQEQARLLMLHFPRGAEYTFNSVKVKITSARVSQGITKEGWYSVPVTIEWRAIV
ncbi:MAG: phage tail terminator-like protein [Halieaceae bacterium]|nr:phage tail terminator-like protein [Halieaceae bacterium]